MKKIKGLRDVYDPEHKKRMLKDKMRELRKSIKKVEKFCFSQIAEEDDVQVKKTLKNDLWNLLDKADEVYFPADPEFE